MEILEDTRQQVHHGDKHAAKHAWWAAHGVTVTRRKLSFGDYMAEGSNVSVDTKASLDELSGNLGRGHRRFRAECERARDAGCRLVVLVETVQASTIADVRKWTHGHCRKCRTRGASGCKPLERTGGCPKHRTAKPLQGPRMADTMEAMERHHGVRFEFCDPRESAARICELLGVNGERDGRGGAQAARDGVQDPAHKAGD